MHIPNRISRVIIGALLLAVLLPAKPGTLTAQEISPASPPSPHPARERLLMDRGWRFNLGDAPDAAGKFNFPEPGTLFNTLPKEIGLEGVLSAAQPDLVATNLGGDVTFVQPGFDDSAWRTLNLPHDWGIELPFNEKADRNHGFKEIGHGFEKNNIGWYRRTFPLAVADKGKTLWLEFDGAYRNSVVWLNGHCLGRNASGYSSFYFDIGKYAKFGGENTLAVRIDASRAEGWFYEGAGIYRHVWLEKTGPLHIAHDGVFVYSHFKDNVPEGPAEIHAQVKLDRLPDVRGDARIVAKVIGPDGQPAGKARAGLRKRGDRRGRMDIAGAPGHFSGVVQNQRCSGPLSRQFAP